MGAAEPEDQVTESLPGAAVPAYSGRLPFERVGPYRLVRSLGAGGMGEVFLAERDDGNFRQEVALKMVPYSLADSERAGRLRRERQILAQLDHPNLVRVLDGGIAPDGTPYLAMEYVRGLSLRAWVGEWHPPLEARLERFLELCAAVSYAHQRLVVHRDIKPGNIMVDEQGHARLLDFGIAKLLAADPSDPAEHTLTVAGMAPMTAAYSSPEQVLGGQVTTATDIYQLGLVLYELLTGNMAQPVTHTSRASEIERFVCRSEPTRPSRAQAGADGVRLPARIAEDIDTVIAKALHKEPGRRYPSAEALGEDIRRIMARQPIMARRDSALYRSRRFIERHLLAVATGLAVFIALIAFGLHERSLRAEAEQLLRDRDEALAQAQTAQKRAESVQGFLLGMFSGADAKEKGVDLRVVDVLDAAQEELLKRFADEPDSSAAVAEQLAKVRQSLGQADKALSLLDAAIPLTEKEFGEDDPRVLEMLRGQIFLADAVRQYARKLAFAELRHQRLARSQGERAPDTLVALSDLGVSRYFAQPDQRERAFAEMRRAAATIREVAGPGDPRTWELLRNEIQFKYVDGRFDEVLAEGPALYEQGIAEIGLRDRSVINIMGFVMNSAGAKGDVATALEINERLQREFVEQYGANNPSLINLLSFRGAQLMRLQRIDEAIEMYEQGLAVSIGSWGRTHPSVVMLQHRLSTALSLSGRHERAMDIAEAVRIEREQAAGQQATITLSDHLYLASLHARAGREDEARRILDEVARRRPDDVFGQWLADSVFIYSGFVSAWARGPSALEDGFIDALEERFSGGTLDTSSSREVVTQELAGLRRRFGVLPPKAEALLAQWAPWFGTAGNVIPARAQTR